MSEPNRIGKYDVTGILGEGSFGIVYQGFDPFIKRRLAIKVCTVEDHDLRRRFYREAEIVGRLQHKNIVTVFAFGTDGDRPYLVQELLDGEDLDKVIRRRDPLEHNHRLQILLQVAGALDYAHRNGVVHRDVKPGNVRLLADGRVKLMDFGIAKLAGAQTQLTREGVTLGTASYLPPEQVRAEPLDHRADVFSFGVLAYELMAYERPFRGNTLSALVYQILYKVPVPLGTVWQACPPTLSALVARCMAKKPEERWSDFGELLPELEKAREAMDSGGDPEATASAIASAGASAAAKLDDTRPVTVVEDEIEAVGVTDRIAALVVENTLPEGDAVDLDAPTLLATDLEALAEKVPDPLKRRAAEIGSLIEQGELRSAMRQLEDTVQEHLDGTRDEPAPEVKPEVVTAPWAMAERAEGMGSEADTQPTRAHEEGADAGAGTPPPATPPPPAAAPTETAPTTVLADPVEGDPDAPDAGVATGRAVAKTLGPDGSQNEPAAKKAPAPVAPVPVSAPISLPVTVPISVPISVPASVPVSAPAARPTPEPTRDSSARRPTEERVSKAQPDRSKTAPGAQSPRAKPASKGAPKLPQAIPDAPQQAGVKSPAPGASPPVRDQPSAGANRLRWAAVAAAILAIFGAVWLLLGRSPEPAPPPLAVARVEPLPPPVVVDPLGGARQGFARLTASPWAEVLEIVDLSGTPTPLPSEPFTPILLRLEPGTYRVTLGHPDLEEPVVCELEIALEAVAECAPVVAPISPLDYFKRVGWWR